MENIDSAWRALKTRILQKNYHSELTLYDSELFWNLAFTFMPILLRLSWSGSKWKTYTIQYLMKLSYFTKTYNILEDISKETFAITDLRPISKTCWHLLLTDSWSQEFLKKNVKCYNLWCCKGANSRKTKKCYSPSSYSIIFVYKAGAIAIACPAK